jgi:outer membrane protein OmpA-like peptidoglycan-associated protein
MTSIPSFRSPFMTAKKTLFTGFALAGLMGCAAVAPAQLIEARETYVKANDGLAGKLTPTELYDAKKVLDKANATFDANGDTWEVRDYAYIAHRKLELANAKARTELDRQKIAEAVKLGVKVRDIQVKNTQDALTSTREQLKDERVQAAATTQELQRDSAAKSAELAKTASQLELEKQARVAAEEKLAGAMKDLAAIAAVKEEARGVVITLSGSVLFVSGKYALLNTAQTKLDQVAEALKAQADNKKIVVEGHTDSQGSDSTNQPLSLNRASAVRDYLVSRGVPQEKISAIGMGSSRPLVDNKSAENRANNRRVEIIIGNPALSGL